MGTVLLIRHGRSVANVEGILAGRAPGVFLDEVGEATASALGEKFADLPIAHVVSSPLDRTLQTADLAFGSRFPRSIEEQINECDYGDWQGRILSELATEPLWKTVQDEPDLMTFPNGESMQSMANRAIAAIRAWDEKLTAEFGSDVIWVAISHGDVIKALCADALSLPLRNFQRISIEPASVSVVQYGKDSAKLHKLNDTGDQWLKTLSNYANTDEVTLGGEVVSK